MSSYYVMLETLKNWETAMSSYYVMLETLKHWETVNVELLCYASNTETFGKQQMSIYCVMPTQSVCCQAFTSIKKVQTIFVHNFRKSVLLLIQ